MFGRERQGAEGNPQGEQRQAGGQQQEENAKQEANNMENKENTENNAKLEQTIKRSLNFHVYKSLTASRHLHICGAPLARSQGQLPFDLALLCYLRFHLHFLLFLLGSSALELEAAAGARSLKRLYCTVCNYFIVFAYMCISTGWGATVALATHLAGVLLQRWLRI
jgi:hypothetical protein